MNVNYTMNFSVFTFQNHVLLDKKLYKKTMTMFQEKKGKRRVQQEQLSNEYIILSNCLCFLKNTNMLKQL
jgi:hypothetical protein